VTRGGIASRASLALVVSCLGCGGEGFEAKEKPRPPSDGLVLWLTADQGVSESAGAVSVWADQSPGHSDALQTDANLRPTLDHGAFGGMGAITFDGQNDYMKLPAGFADFTGGLSFFSTFTFQRNGTCSAFLEFSNGAEIDDINFGSYGDNAAFEVLDGFSNAGTLVAGSPQLYTVVQHADESTTMRINGAGAWDGTIALPANILRQDGFVGNTLYGGCTVLGGNIGEILLYDRPVTDREMLDIEAYLGKHAGCCQ
jgi:hypothetical protein